MKKSQITIFIILGIVVLVIFGIFYSLQKQTSDKRIDQRINKIYADFLSANNVKQATTGCLDRVSKEGIFLVSIQGGRIYNYQMKLGYNITNFYEVVPYNYSRENASGIIYNVSYGIMVPSTEQLPYPEAPDYPYLGSLVESPLKTFDYGSFSGVDSKFFSIFAYDNKSNMEHNYPVRALCRYTGANANERFNDPTVKGTCEKYSEQESVQAYLEEYISENIFSCLNFTFIEGNSGRTHYNITPGNPYANMIFGDDDLIVNLSYPIEISINDEPPRTQYLSFNIRQNIRLKKIHEAASHLTKGGKFSKADANNIFFNITRGDPTDCRPFGASPCLTGINVSREENYCLKAGCGFNNRHYTFSDIIIIEDKQSLINGYPLRFQFAVENRRPALDFIDEGVAASTFYYKYVNTTFGKNLTEAYSNDKCGGHPISVDYNIKAKKGSDVLIYPSGVDPDEDPLSYSVNVMEGSAVVLGDIIKYTPHDISGGVRLNITVNDTEGLYDYQVLDISVDPIEC